MANFMARVPLNADFRSRSSYSFLTKSGWKASYSGLDDLEPVLGDQAQGAIFKLPYNGGFAPFKKPYMWLGVNKWLDSKMWLGCAEHIEGPWDIQLLGMAPELMGKNSGHRYCLYPHIWGSKLNEGELLISWSDDGVMGGKVACAYAKIKVEPIPEEQSQEAQRLQEEEERKSKATPVAAAEATQNTQQIQEGIATMGIHDGAADEKAAESTQTVPASSAEDFQPQNDTETQPQKAHEKHPHLHAFKDKIKHIVHEHKH